MLITANRAVSRTAFYAPNTGSIGSYPTRSMDVYAPIFVHPADVQTFIRVEPSTRELYKILEKKIRKPSNRSPLAALGSSPTDKG